MNKIKSMSQNSDIVITELKTINKKIKPKTQERKSFINSNYPLNQFKRNNIFKYSTKLNTSSIISKNYGHTPDRKYYSKIRTVKTNDKRLKNIINQKFFRIIFYVIKT